MTRVKFSQTYIVVTLILVSLSLPALASDYCRELKRKYDLPVRLIEDRSGILDELIWYFRLLPDIRVGWVSSNRIVIQLQKLGVCINVSETKGAFILRKKILSSSISTI